MVLVMQASWSEEPARKFRLCENIRFITEVLSVNKGAVFLRLLLNLIITVSFFFKRWHTWRLSDLTQWPVRESALQMLFSRAWLLIDVGINFISNDVWWSYCALLTVLLYNWTILSLSKWSLFLVIDSSGERISYLLKKIIETIG